MATVLTPENARALREQMRELTSYTQHVLTCPNWETGGCACGLDKVLARTPDLIALLDAPTPEAGPPGSD